MPFASLTSQLSSAAGKRARLTAGSGRTTNPDRRHGHPCHCHAGRGHGGSPCPEDVTATPHLCTVAHAGAGRDAKIPWRHVPLLKWAPQTPSCFSPRLLCKFKCLLSTFGVLKGAAASGVSYLQSARLLQKPSASAGKPILPPSSEQNGHSLPFLSQNLKSPCPSQAIQVGLRLSNSVCKIKKVIAWRGGPGPKPHDSSNLNSSTYKLSRTF